MDVISSYWSVINQRCPLTQTTQNLCLLQQQPLLGVNRSPALLLCFSNSDPPSHTALHHQAPSSCLTDLLHLHTSTTSVICAVTHLHLFNTAFHCRSSNIFLWTSGGGAMFNNFYIHPTQSMSFQTLTSGPPLKMPLWVNVTLLKYIFLKQNAGCFVVCCVRKCSFMFIQPLLIFWCTVSVCFYFFTGYDEK